ncbi:hypothetical protein PFISCL1PPCAC_21344, partial [Pristionchus fissidentatus]
NHLKGFIVDGTITIEARIKLKNVMGIKELTQFDFSAPSVGTDLILRVEGKDVHVGRQYLTTHSPVFAAMFYGDFIEKEKAEIELKDVKYEEFIDLLHVIYPSGRAVNFDTYKPILALADFYQIKFARDQVESYLIRTELVKMHEKIELADQYRLKQLQYFCLQSFKTVHQIKELHSEGRLDSLSESMQAALHARTMELPLE